jgi:hypothetical protein
VGSLFAALVVSYALAIFLVRGKADRREAERITRAIAAKLSELPDPRHRQLMYAPPPAEFVPARELPPEPPRPTRCRSCPLYGCAAACPVVNPVLQVLDSVGRPWPVEVVEVSVAERPKPVRVYAEGGYVPGSATRAYRAILKPAPTRRVRGDLRCLACVQPVIQDDDGWWLFHSPSCPREHLPLEVAIGKTPPDPLYPPHRW